jgi:C-3',4' desaturase CrtD
MTKHIVVIGAGIGGLTSGALLLKQGYKVTILEAHVYPGGCAGTFYHKKYRFDAGATLAGGFSAGGPHHYVAETLGLAWPIKPVDPAWVVHLPNGQAVTQWANAESWRVERQAHFPFAEQFWKTQEMLADVAWDISSRPFPWPPESAADLLRLSRSVRPRTVKSLPYLARTIGSIAPIQKRPMFKAFLDSQLLISAQTTSEYASALYGSAAIDLPRRGVNHVVGGIGALAETWVSWIRANGGEVHYRQEAVKIELRNGVATAVITKKGLRVACDFVLGNLTPWGLQKLWDEEASSRQPRETGQKLAPTWGAFMIYLGIDKSKFFKKFPKTATHHQVIVDENKPLGETNSVFFSMANPDDPGRAPIGQVPVTVSTHTEIGQWWQLHESDPQQYEEQKEAYAEKMLTALSRALPGVQDCVTFCTAGTPVSFERFTRRPLGMVGGFAQTSIFNARGPKTRVKNVLMVGDSIFPGQSTAGVTLGGMRVARQVHKLVRA